MGRREEILANIDVLNVLAKLGVEVVRTTELTAECKCPLHPDTNPSFRIDLASSGSKHKGRWTCFAGCKSELGNSLFDLIIATGNANDFETACSFLGAPVQQPTRPATRTRTRKAAPISEATINRRVTALWSDPLAVSHLMIERGISKEQLELYNVGLQVTPQGQGICIPQGDPPNQMKYIRWPKGTGEPRFWSSKGFRAGIWPTPDPAADYVLIVESELDALLLRSLGMNASSVAGASGFSYSRLKELIMSNQQVVLFPDNDDEGLKAAGDLINRVRQEGLEIAMPNYDGLSGKDIGEHYKLHGEKETLDFLRDVFQPAEKAARRKTCPWSLLACGVDQNGDRYILKTLRNLRMIMEHDSRWSGLLWKNEMSSQSMFREAGLHDEEVTAVYESMESTYSVKWSYEDVWRQVKHVCSLNKVHPVKDYLNQLTWDGTQRIDSLISGGIVQTPPEEDCALKRSYIRKWLISCVARIFEPGCQADSMLVFYSKDQGIGKSSFARVLGGDWYLDTPIDPHNKDMALACHANWIVEVGELDATTRKRDMSALRGFLSKREDLIRQPYARQHEIMLRGFVFIGTTNDLGVIREEDGRRYWPVETYRIDYTALEAFRDQIWAEATHWYNSGECWHLSPDQEKCRRDDNEGKFREIDVTHEIIATYINESMNTGGLPLQEITLAVKDAGLSVQQHRVISSLRRCGLEPRMITNGRTKGSRRWFPVA